jgi:uncharacterized protein
MSMNYADEYSANDLFAIDAVAEERAAFIRRTYLHLSAAILAFISLELAYFSIPGLPLAVMGLVGGNWWIALIAFIAVSWLAQSWAHTAASSALQYMGLALYTVALSVIFLPLLFIAMHVGGPESIQTAGILTATIFGGLTAVVFITKADFSFMRNILWMATFGALGLVIASAFMGFSLGLLFASGMIVLFSGWILYDTSNILHHYRTDQHVGAALELFASVAMLFWYVLRLILILQSND